MKATRPQTPDLIVDLDGTLLRSDMLYESFWAAFGRDWTLPLAAARHLRQGRAQLKRHMAETAEVDVARLPYNPAVLSYIEAWRAEQGSAGGKVALVTAADQAIAERIAAHLGVFDTVHGSDGQTNLKGQQKADFLTEHYGASKDRSGFVYMGDSQSDLDVWKAAQGAVTVNAPENLRKAASEVCVSVEHIGPSTPDCRPYLKALRPHQWIKNILVFLPVFTAHQFTGASLLQAFFAFVSFSLIASSVYVFNDLLDLSADRAHPRKCRRPFAAGCIPIAHGNFMAMGLIVAGTMAAVALGGAFLLVMAVYYVLTTAYSLDFKRRTVIDVCTLAGLYTIRIIAGGAATGIALSVWLLAFAIFFFFSLAAVKRQAELIDTQRRGKLGASGRGYQVDDLPIISMMAIASGYVSVMIMALYVNSPAVLELYSQPMALWGVCCLLLYWLSRTIMQTHRGHMDDDPVLYAVKDRVSQICGALILFFAVGGAVL